MKKSNNIIATTTTTTDGIMIVVLDRKPIKQDPAGVRDILSRSLRKTMVVKTVCFPMNKGLIISDEPIDF